MVKGHFCLWLLGRGAVVFLFRRLGGPGVWGRGGRVRGGDAGCRPRPWALLGRGGRPGGGVGAGSDPDTVVCPGGKRCLGGQVGGGGVRLIGGNRGVGGREGFGA